MVRTMKVTLGKLVDSADSLGRIVQLPLKAKIAYRSKKLVEFSDRELKNFNDRVLDLYKKYGELVEGDKYRLIPDNTKQFLKEMDELRAEEVEFHVLPIKVDDLGDNEISILDISRLDYFIMEENAQDVPN
jgi:hypothetical protein